MQRHSHLSEAHPHLAEYKRHDHHHKEGKRRARRSVLILDTNRREATSLARGIFRLWRPRLPDPTRIHSTSDLVHLHLAGCGASPILFVSALHRLAEPEIEHLYTTFEMTRHNIVAVSNSGTHELAPSFEHTINLLRQPELPITLNANETNPRLAQHTRQRDHFSKLGTVGELAGLIEQASYVPDLIGMKDVYQFLVQRFPQLMGAYSYNEVRKWNIPAEHNPGVSCRKRFSTQRVTEFFIMRHAQ